jgi:hypothetical protein
MGMFGVMAVALAVTGGNRVEPTATHVEVSLAAFRFLEAVRTGDDHRAAAMLTAKARKKTSEMGMVIAPPGSDSARFTLGVVVLGDKDTACVRSEWTDRDSTGSLRTDPITWVLRREAGGWRISGMSVTVIPGEPPILLDFEDPEDMLRKQQSLQQSLQ